MITYGYHMQGREEVVPKEVAAWLLERDSHYPKVDFEVNCVKPHQTHSAEHEALARKYSRFYAIGQGGSTAVTFPYLSEYWQVRIIGGVDRNGTIWTVWDGVDRIPKDLRPLPPKLTAEIAALPDAKQLERIVVEAEELPRRSVEVWGLPRKESEPVQDAPQDFLPLAPDAIRTGVSISPEVFVALSNDPETRDELSRAIREKDQEALKRLKEKKKGE